MTIPNWVVPGFTLVYTTAFSTSIQNSAVTGTWILDALTVSPGSVTVAYSARSTGNIEYQAGQDTFVPGSASGFGFQFWVDPTSTAAAIASIRGPEGETYGVAGTETYDGVNATVLSFSGPTASSVIIYQTSTGLILHESASYPSSAEILEFSTVLTAPPPPPAPNPAPPAGTTADMILRNTSGTYEIYDIGNNAILGGCRLGQVGTEWGYVTVGGFFGSDTTDLLLRNGRTGAFEVYDVSNNNITNAASLGAVGLNWQVMGFGNFSSRGENDMILRNSSTGGVEVYDLANNQITGAAFMGTVGLNWQFSGIGNFSGAGESDMLLRNANTGGLEVYDIANNAITGAAFIGTIGLDWQFSGVGNFSGVPGKDRSLVAQQQDRRVGSLQHQQQPTHRRRLSGHGRFELAVRGHRLGPRTRRVRSGVAQRQHRPILRLRHRRQSTHGRRPVGLGRLGLVARRCRLRFPDRRHGRLNLSARASDGGFWRWRRWSRHLERRSPRCRRVTTAASGHAAARLRPGR